MPGVSKSSRASPRPWSTDEHEAFLRGVKVLGRGRWSALARQFVPGRTATQARATTTFCTGALPAQTPPLGPS